MQRKSHCKRWSIANLIKAAKGYRPSKETNWTTEDVFVFQLVSTTRKWLCEAAMRKQKSFLRGVFPAKKDNIIVIL